jgi:hypothetical protein
MECVGHARERGFKNYRIVVDLTESMENVVAQMGKSA